MQKPKVLVTGGTGFIGRPLVHRLIDVGWDVVVSTRDASKASRLFKSPVELIQWDAMAGPMDLANVSDLQAVVNLAGENLFRPWTPRSKTHIHDSRVLGTRHLVQGLMNAKRIPNCFVSASAIGIYGDRRDQALDERSSTGLGFIPNLCREWEEGAQGLQKQQVRTVILRLGTVLGREGGALAGMLPVFRMGLGFWLGSGGQWLSWIHLQDLLKFVIQALQDPTVEGVFNVVAPHPVTFKDFSKSLGKCLRRPVWTGIPRFVLMAGLGEAAEMMFWSQKVYPRHLTESGFEFEYSTLEAAFANLLS
jgi:uncharacterized protein (TIGR01777 family)